MPVTSSCGRTDLRGRRTAATPDGAAGAILTDVIIRTGEARRAGSPGSCAARSRRATTRPGWSSAQPRRGPAPGQPSDHAVEPVAGVAQPGHDVALLVEPLVH